jgi:precorrin-6B methylase 2
MVDGNDMGHQAVARKKRLPEAGFADVDNASRPETLIDYLTMVNGLSGVRSYKQQAFAMLKLREADHVLDVGCGTGDDVRALAALVGASGRVVGLDRSTNMIAAARRAGVTPGGVQIPGRERHAPSLRGSVFRRPSN